MSGLNSEFKSYLKQLFTEKNFSKLEFELETLGEIKNFPENIIYLYAISKTLNLNSKTEDYKKALDLLISIFEKNKKNLEVLYNLILVSLKAKSYFKVKKFLEDNLKENSDDDKILEGLAKINYVLGNVDESVNHYKKLFELNPQRTTSRLSFLATLNYTTSISQEKYFEECKKYSQLLEKNSQINKEFEISKKKINIGFFSSDLKKHSVSYFLKDVIRNIDKNQFEISAFSNLEKSNQDKMSFELKTLFDNWYDVYEYSDNDLVKFIKEKKIGILIDLNGFTLGNRNNIFVQRSAPIQVLWCGYCNTTGLENMDFIITDKNCIKKEEEHLYSEQIIYLPKVWNAMSKPKNLPNISALPYKNENIFTFGSFNNFQKITDKTIDVWSKILIQTDSRILLKNSIIDSQDINSNLKEKFVKRGVKDNQITILKFQKDENDHLSNYNKIDLALDPFPYNGVTTTFEAILMGVPVLTLKGFNFNSRCGESINKNLDMEKFIASDYDEYVNKAINFTKDEKYLSELRKEIRSKALSSYLFKTEDFTEAFSQKMKDIWMNFLS